MRDLFLSLIALVVLVSSPPLHAQDMEWEWIKSATGNADVRSVTTDPWGNVYVTGSFSSDLGIDSVKLSSIGWSSDAYLLKFDPDGNAIWGKSAGGDRMEYCFNVETDAEGNVYIAGHFCSNTATFDSITLINTYQTPYIDDSRFDVFTAKYTSDGDVVWAKSGGGIYHDHALSLCTDNAGNSYTFGYFQSPIVVFDSLRLANTGNRDLFLIKYDSDGNLVWGKSAVGDGQDDPWSVTSDSENNVYIGGSYRSSSITFDDTTLVNTSTNFDIYLVKFTSEGDFIWARSAVGDQWDNIDGIAIDDEDNIYITGFFRSDSLCFDPVTLHLSESDGPNKDMFLLKLDNEGRAQWGTSSEGGAWIYPNGIATYGSSTISVTGTFTHCAFGDTEGFGSTSVTTVHSYDIFTVNYDSSGNDQWAESIGGWYMDFGQDVHRDGDGNLYLAAFFQSDTVIIDSLTLVNDFNSKMIVGKKRIRDVSVTHHATESPKQYFLSAFPNPFNHRTSISYALNSTSDVELSIYNLQGQHVKSLVHTTQPPGAHSVPWDGTDDTGKDVASGIYFYRLKTDELSKTMKLALIK